MSFRILRYVWEPNSREGYGYHADCTICGRGGYEYRVDCVICGKTIRRGGWGNAAGQRYDIYYGGKADREHMEKHRLRPGAGG